MFVPQRYMTLTTDKDKIKLSKMVFSIEEAFYESFINSYDIIGLISFFEKYKDDMVIIVDNNKKAISIFQELIDDGEPVPGLVMMFEDHIMFLLTSRSVPQGIKRIGEEVKKDESGEDNIIKLPDIRKLLERV